MRADETLDEQQHAYANQPVQCERPSHYPILPGYSLMCYSMSHSQQTRRPIEETIAKWQNVAYVRSCLSSPPIVSQEAGMRKRSETFRLRQQRVLWANGHTMHGYFICIRWLQLSLIQSQGGRPQSTTNKRDFFPVALLMD